MLCSLDVWQFSYLYPIDGSRCKASAFAEKHASPKHLAQILRDAELYGTYGDRAKALENLASKFVETARQCSAFERLKCNGMMRALVSIDLIGSENELLDAVLKCVELNPYALEVDIEGLYSCIRLEMLKDMSGIEELLVSEDSPRALVLQSSCLFVSDCKGMLL